MAWNLSTGAKLALLAKTPNVDVSLIAATISFGDGDGTGGTDTINDSGSGLGVFAQDDYILVVNGTNANTMVKAITVAAGKIEVIAGSFTTEAAGSNICLIKISTGAFAEVFRNAVADIRSGTRPSTADLVESGTLLMKLTKDAGVFVAGTSANGLNWEMSSTTLKRATDPETGVSEVWKGIGLVTGTPGHVRVYANDYTTGASSSAVRMDGVVSSSGADMNITTGNSVTVDVYAEVSDVSFTVSSS